MLFIIYFIFFFSTRYDLESAEGRIYPDDATLDVVEEKTDADTDTALAPTYDIAWESVALNIPTAPACTTSVFPDAVFDMTFTIDDMARCASDGKHKNSFGCFFFFSFALWFLLLFFVAAAAIVVYFSQSRLACPLVVCPTECIGPTSSCVVSWVKRLVPMSCP